MTILIYISILYLIMLIIITGTVRDVLSKISLIIYLSWWVIWLSISALNPFRLNSVSSKVYLILIINVLMFSFCFILYGTIKSKPKQQYNVGNTFNSYIIDNRVFKIILIILLIVVLYLFNKYLSVAQLLGGSGGRGTLFEVSDLFSNKIEYYLYYLVISPFSEFIIVVLISMIVFQRKIILLIISLIFGLAYGYIGFGRGYYVNILISLGFILVIKTKLKETHIYSLGNRRSIISNVVNRRIIVTIFIVLIAVMTSFITAQRMGYFGYSPEAMLEGAKEFGMQSVVYMTGPFRALDYAITNNYVKNTGLFYGRATLGGFDDLIKIFIHGLGGQYESSNDLIIPLLQNEYIPISYELKLNFAFTNVMIHLLDYGLLGVFVIPFVFGLFVRHMFFKFIEIPTFPMLVIIVYIFKSMILTVFKWEYQFGPSIILLIVLLLLHRAATTKYRKTSKTMIRMVSI